MTKTFDLAGPKAENPRHGKGAVMTVGPDQPKTAASGSGRILLMDDDPDIRGVAVAMLQMLGYEVASAADCNATLALYREALGRGSPFDAVILDLTVSGGPGGRETLARLRGIDPSVRAFASSGYSDDEVLVDPPAFGFVGAIGKPYTVEQLASTLARGLARRGARR